MEWSQSTKSQVRDIQVKCWPGKLSSNIYADEGPYYQVDNGYYREPPDYIEIILLCYSGCIHECYLPTVL
jgi:hypothetical protein